MHSWPEGSHTHECVRAWACQVLGLTPTVCTARTGAVELDYIYKRPGHNVLVS